ncbi:MAG: glycosyltransferase family 2 protein [Bacilli bacterium]|jgi:glycosyltransferase involved in cell wall biosynthesis
MSVVAIIPALNEEKTIKRIIEMIKVVPLVDRIIVVSDGSKDNTANIARRCGVEVIDLKENIGKGGAMSIGVKSCQEEIILFLDADLIGLTRKHIEDLLKPVVEDNYAMSLGVFVHGKVGTDLAHMVAPFLSGQRVITRQLFNKVNDIEISRYGVEMALTRYIEKNNIAIKKIKLNGLTHLTKEEKLGFFTGVTMRFKMYKEIIAVFFLNILK